MRFDLALNVHGGNSITVTADNFDDDAGAGSFVRHLSINALDGSITTTLSIAGQIVGAFDVSTDNAAAAAITLNTAGGTFTSNTGMTFENAVLLDGATNLATNGIALSDIHFASTLDGGVALVLDTGAAGETLFSGTVTNLASIDATGAVEIAGVDVSTTGNITLDELEITGAADVACKCW